MTKKQTEKAGEIQARLNAGGLPVKVAFTARGYLRLIVPQEARRKFSCAAGFLEKAREILDLSPLQMGSIYISYE